MARTATGFIAGPERPPVLPPRCGLIESRLMTIPRTVFISASASAPASTTPLAIEGRSVTSGESLAMIGSSPPMVFRTPSMTRRDASGSQAKTRPRFSTFGQLMLTSTALRPETDLNLRASVAYSSIVSPAIETITRAFCSSSQGTSLARKESIPGPCNPIELSIPDGVSAMRGVGRPWRGLVITDLVTTAPISFNAKNWASSLPLLAHPLAVNMGEGNQALPSVVDISTGIFIVNLEPFQQGPNERSPHP